MSCIAVRSAISDFDRPFVTTVGALTAADVVDWTDAVGVAVGATGVVRVPDGPALDVGAELLVVTALGLLLLVVVTADEDTAVGTLDDDATSGGVPATADDPVFTTDGTAVSVVGPATVDVHELSRTAATEQPTNTPLRHLLNVSTPTVVPVTLPANALLDGRLSPQRSR